jgi:hypothetical protein
VDDVECAVSSIYEDGFSPHHAGDERCFWQIDPARRDHFESLGGVSLRAMDRHQARNEEQGQ